MVYCHGGPRRPAEAVAERLREVAWVCMCCPFTGTPQVGPFEDLAGEPPDAEGQERVEAGDLLLQGKELERGTTHGKAFEVCRVS